VLIQFLSAKALGYRDIVIVTKRENEKKRKNKTTREKSD